MTEREIVREWGSMGATIHGGFPFIHCHLEKLPKSKYREAFCIFSDYVKSWKDRGYTKIFAIVSEANPAMQKLVMKLGYEKIAVKNDNGIFRCVIQ